MTKHKFECLFCGSKFVLEDRYLKHRCNAMIRDEEIRTPTGIAALSYYQLWMKEQKRQIPNVETFLTSKLYTTFFKFATFAKKIGIPNVEQFVKYMIRHDIHPTIWSNDQIYGDYLQYLDRGKDPKTQAEYTVDYLFKISDALGCEVGEVFNHLHASDVIHMLKKRQLSPWILLHSAKFRDFLTNKTTSEEKMVLQSIIKPSTWTEKRKNNPKIVQLMKEIVRELNL